MARGRELADVEAEIQAHRDAIVVLHDERRTLLEEIDADTAVRSALSEVQGETPLSGDEVG